MRRDTGLILALDETDAVRALKVAAAVSDQVDAIKVNWPLILTAGPEIITKLSEISDVICDLKVADIPNTVRLIVEGAVARNASGVIVHAFTGEDSLREAVSAARKADIFAVTEMSHPGGAKFTAQHAEEMAEMGVRCGVAGFIAPATRPERIKAIR
ncbi:MAG: orotidine-5'-phosphate decarboxylase, partial [Methanomassiliicoccaceae archaeon]|nr:orotidine-5'-phosphate decarboxylase [Methanomassiliicoccaceae archaeon]